MISSFFYFTQHLPQKLLLIRTYYPFEKHIHVKHVRPLMIRSLKVTI